MTLTEVKTGEHKPLFVLVADWGVKDKTKYGSFKWNSLYNKFSTLKEVKVAAENFLFFILNTILHNRNTERYYLE